MKRIAVDGRELDGKGSGIRRFLLNLFACVEQLGAPLRFLVFSRTATHSLQTGTKHCEFHSLPYSNDFYMDLFGFSKAERSLQNQGEPWKLFFSPYYKTPFRIDSPVCSTIHDLIPLSASSKKSQLYFRFRLRHTLAKANHIATVSAFSQDQIATRYRIPREKITTLHNVVADYFTDQEKTNDQHFLNQYGLQSGHYLLWVGTLSPHKNWKGLLEAYSKLPLGLQKEFPLAVNLEDSSNQQTNANIRFLGKVSDDALPALYRHAALFVFPSISEGFGLPPIEAMACGAPVAASNTTSIPEVIGKEAFYFDPNNYQQMSNQLREALESPTLRKKRSELGIQHAQQYRIPHAMKPLVQLLHEME